MIITFQGASDDLVEVSGAPGEDEFNVNPDSSDCGYAGTWLVTSTLGVVLVDAYYDGVWSFAAKQQTEGDIIEYDIRTYAGTGGMNINNYSTVLAIQAPNDAKVFKVDGRHT